MTKKSTWSGYRGDGKTSVPCVPECLKKQAEKQGRLVKAPTDYVTRTKRVPTSNRKLRRAIRNEILASPLKVSSTRIYYTDYHTNRINNLERNSLAIKSFENGDLDMALVHRKFVSTAYTKIIEETVLTLREMGHEETYEVVTMDHLNTFSEITEELRELNMNEEQLPILYLGGRGGNENYLTAIPLGARGFARIAFAGELEKEAVLELIRGRKISNHSGVGKLVEEMLVNYTALTSGVL